MEDWHVLDNKKGYIRSLLYNGQFKDAFKEMNLFYKSIKHNRNIKPYLWFIYYNKSYIYLKEHNYKMAEKFAKKACGCYTNIDEKIKTIWMVARIGENSNMKKSKIIRCYLQCSREYKNIDKIRLRISVLFNICKLNNDTKRMYKLIMILKNTDSSTYRNYYKDTNKNNVIDDIVIELLDFCIEKKDFRTLNKISKNFNSSKIKKHLNDSNLFIK